MSGLNTRIGGRPPKKRQVNLIKKEKQPFFTAKRVIVILVVLAVAAVGGAYAYKRAQDVAALRKQLATMETEYDLAHKQAAAYNAVENEYIRYSEAYKTAAEQTTLDSRAMVDKARELIDPYGYITTMSVRGNEMTVVLFAKDINQVLESLNSDPNDILTTVVPVSESKQTNELGEYVISTATFRLLFAIPKEAAQ